MTNKNQSSKFANLISNTGKTLLATTAMTAVGLLAMSGNAQAQVIDPNTTPTGGTEVFGDITITQTGLHTDVHQIQDIGLIEWLSFNHGEDATTEFRQPDTSSWTFNRVTGNVDGARTIIAGKITANGNIGILDDNGVLITDSGSLDAAGVMLSTGSVTNYDEALESGHFEISNFGEGEIVNDGSITVAEGGLAAFVSPNVKNSGVINAKMGTVVMAAGEVVTLDMYGDGLVEVAVDGEVAEGLIENTGNIKANGGNVIITASVAKNAVDNVINMDGIVDVSSATVKGGKIVLSGGSKGAVKVSGKLDASGTTGGDIKVTGENVLVADTAELRADGGLGGSQQGNGGRIDVIAQRHTDFRGRLIARGGVLGGDGGNAEISGYEFLGYEGLADLSAENGEVGSLLLDPEFAVIHSGILNNPLGLGYVLSAQALANSMEAATITVQADNFIDVGTKIDAYDTGNAIVDAILNGLVGTGDIDLSAYNYSQLEQTGTGSFFGIPFPIFGLVNYNGITAGGITLQSDTVNFNKDVIMGDGNLGVDANTVNLGSRLYDKDGTTALGDSRLFSNAGEVNVLSTAALIQQGIYLADDAGDATVNVAADTYNESVVVDKAVKLLGANAGTDGNDVGRVAETIITPNSPGFLVTANNVTIDGFTIDGASQPNTIGVDIQGASLTNVENNIILRTGPHAVRFADSSDVSISNNKIENVGNNGIAGQNSEDITIADNTIHQTSADGIAIVDSEGIDITGNTITKTDGDGVEIFRSSDIEIDDNTIDLLGGNVLLNSEGIELINVGDISITNNRISNADQNAIRGLNVTGDTEISNNEIDNMGENGISIDNFDRAWISYNHISLTGGHGIHAVNGDFVSIYDNYVDLSGFESNAPAFGNTQVNSNADGIHVENITGENIPELNVEITGFGVSTYGSAVEIYGNEVANVADDGVDVENAPSTYIANNLIGHAGDDGVDVDNVGVTIVRDNAISTVGNRGIAIQGGEVGRYAGLFDNRILLTGDDGIQVEGIYGGQDAMTLGDVVYGYGWSVNVSGNEVAMTGDDGIEVRDSGPTQVRKNKVFMAGMGQQVDDVIETINVFASQTGVPPYTISSEDNSFVSAWGDGHGINVHGIDGAYNSPNGWAVDIRGNDVKYTGGHGIRAEENDRTRVANNSVKYAGIDMATFNGAGSLMALLNDGPFKSSNPGRRDLWADDSSMIDVIDGYIGRDEEGSEDIYVTISDIEFDSHDGIHVEDIYGLSREGRSKSNYLFDLKIRNNVVKFTGDDGIEVDGAGRTLIAENKIRDAGYGDIDEPEEYGSGDYDGADGIHVSNVTADVFGGTVVREGGIEENPEEPTEEESYKYEPNRNYALIVRNNDIRRTADDGIEVVGSGEIPELSVGRAAGVDDVQPKEEPYYSGTTDRVLIAENTIRETGYFDSENVIEEQGRENGYNNVGPDGYGHDGIHVRNVTGTFYDEPNQKQGPGGSYRADSVFYGYAVDVLNNDVRKTGDDGIEVFNSESTLILGNTVRQSGVYWGEEGRPNTDGADYYGADGIHVRNVGGADPDYGTDGYAGPDGFEPYSVAIVDNDVRRTADDGIEVVGESLINDDWNPEFDRISEDWDDEDAYQYNGTGRTIILANTTRDNGVSGSHGYNESYSYDSREGSSSSYKHYGNRGSYDGYGGDGIHVRGVGSSNNVINPWIGDTIIVASAGNAGNAGGPVYGRGVDYAVKVIGNDVRRTGDDGIEVIGTSFNDNLNVRAGLLSDGWYPSEGDGYRVLVEDNFVKKSGLSGGHSVNTYTDYSGRRGNGYTNSYKTIYHGNAGEDGYGADGIHVRNVGVNDNPWVMARGAGSGGEGGSYFGYAVDIIGNTVRQTGDDGIEVRNSDSAFIAHNNVKNAGVLSSSTYESVGGSVSLFGNYKGGSVDVSSWTGGSNRDEKGNYTGADGIHVENVGTNGLIMSSRLAGGIGSGDGFEQYAVVIYDNDVNKSSDDGIEVLESGRTRIEMNDVRNSGFSSYSAHGHESSVSSRFGSISTHYSSESSEGAAARDGRGADGIHVDDVHTNDILVFVPHEDIDSDEESIVTRTPYGHYELKRVDSVEIINNTVDNSADDGIQVTRSSDTLIRGNDVSNSGLSTSYGDGDRSPGLALIGGGYHNSYEYGGEGTIDATGGDGINVSRDRIRGEKDDFRPRVANLAQTSISDSVEEFDESRPVRVRIINNDVTDSADDGVEVIGSRDEENYSYRSSRDERTNVVVRRNEIENSGDNGISLITGSPIFFESDEESLEEQPSVSLVYESGGRMNSRTIDNIVTDSGNSGLFVGGPNHNRVIVSGNTFTDFDIGAHFQSGQIDLTGEGNGFNGGRIGMRFSPAEISMMDYSYDVKEAEVSFISEDPVFADMNLINNTIGAQTFNGQSSFFVELDNGAFFDPGTPTLLSAQDSTFVGTPFGTFTPSVDYAGGFPLDVLAYLESKFFHFNDDGTLGLFFFPLLPEISQEDIFNFFGPYADALGGLNITILALPNVPGQTPIAVTNNFSPTTPTALNALQTAAGDETDPAALNEIETAAGGEETGCWGDALNSADAGQTTTLNYSGSAEDLLNSEAGCGSNNI